MPPELPKAGDDGLAGKMLQLPEAFSGWRSWRSGEGDPGKAEGGVWIPGAGGPQALFLLENEQSRALGKLCIWFGSQPSLSPGRC